MYDGSFGRFLAAGNVNGLFIIIDKTKKRWFPTNEEAFFSDFKLMVEIHQQSYLIAYKSGKLKIIKS